MPLLALLAAALLPAATPDTLTLPAAQDNTLYEAASGNLSNGKGSHLFAGVTGTSALRRALLRFDVAAALPPGSMVTSVELRLVNSKTLVTLPKPATLHRVLQAWGEGDSDAAGEEGEGAFAAPGDATWTQRFFPATAWPAGGDFVTTPSATADVGPVGDYAWLSTPELVADVQLWLDQPATDHGWVLRGAEGPQQSSKRFNSREHPDVATRPVLRIEYLPPAGCGGSWQPYGTGLPGAGGLAPTLAGSGCPHPGSALTLALAHGRGGASGLLLIGLAPAAVPFKGGTLLLGPIVLQAGLVLGGPAGEAGAGSAVLPAALPDDPLLLGVALALQAGFADDAAEKGVSLSAGLSLVIG
jgi:hypothetical protein